MLERTFSHIPGVGTRTERELWRQGCDSWARYLDQPGAFSIGGASRGYFRDQLLDSQDALAEGRFQFFRERLGTREAWRAWPAFRPQAMYLDIETDGGLDGDSVTVVGTYDGESFRALVKGDDLGNFRDLQSRFGMIVTFFGTGFDVPMLKRAFPGLVFDQIHFDLCPALKRTGLRGGLKKIERELGIARSDETDGLNGLDAIRLWRQYQHGDEEALRTLVEYNREDVVNLERLAEIAYARLREMALYDAGLAE